MKALFNAFWLICLLKRGPQDLPASRELLGILLVVHLVSGVFLSIINYSFAQAVLVALLGTLIMVGMVQGILALNRKGARLVQTLSAMAGCETLFGLVALPISLWFHSGEGKDGAVMLSLLVLGWSIAVSAHIFRHALSTGPGLGFGTAIFYTFVSYWIASLIMGGA